MGLKQLARSIGGSTAFGPVRWDDRVNVRVVSEGSGVGEHPVASCLSGFAFVAKFAYSANELQAIDMDRGFFWHQHDCRIGAEQPLSNQHYWLPKLARNVERDEMAGKQLVHEGWEVLVVWECQTRKTAELQQLVASFLTGAASRPE